jgi:hypothetical protein
MKNVQAAKAKDGKYYVHCPHCGCKSEAVPFQGKVSKKVWERASCRDCLKPFGIRFKYSPVRQPKPEQTTVDPVHCNKCGKLLKGMPIRRLKAGRPNHCSQRCLKTDTPFAQHHTEFKVATLLKKYDIPPTKLGKPSTKRITKAEKARMKYLMRSAQMLDLLFVTLIQPGMTWELTTKFGKPYVAFGKEKPAPIKHSKRMTLTICPAKKSSRKRK